MLSLEERVKRLEDMMLLIVQNAEGIPNGIAEMITSELDVCEDCKIGGPENGNS